MTYEESRARFETSIAVMAATLEAGDRAKTPRSLMEPVEYVIRAHQLFAAAVIETSKILEVKP